MGKYFNTAEDVHRINLPDGQWIDIRKELTVEASDRLLQSMANMKLEGGEAQTNLIISRLSLMEAYVFAWSFQEEPGKPVPITRDNLSNLKIQYRAPLLEEIYRMQRESREWAEKN